MLHGDPQLDRAVRAETRKAGRGRRNLLIAVVGVIVFVLALSLVAALATPVSGETPRSSPAVPSPSALVDIEDVFPTAAEISEAIGAEVTTSGVESDLSQLWEGASLDPSTVVARTQAYGLSDDVTEEMVAMALIDVVRFGDVADALTSSEDMSSAIGGPLAGFETELSADLVAASSWASDDGFGGSTIVARHGPNVVIVTVAKAGAEEAAVATETVAALVLDRLSAGVGSTTAQSPAASPDAAGQRVELPGYGVSIIVPEHWTTDLSGNTGRPLFPESQLYEDLSLVATGGPEAQQCRLIASSPSTCHAPVDLSAELAAPVWELVSLPAGDAAYQTLDFPETPDVACSRYVLSDGLDVYELRCCGSDRPADAWRPIADSFTFPEQSRWDSPDADGRDLLEEVGVVWQKQGVWPAGSIYGSGETQTAKQWINRPRNKLSRGEVAAIRAMVDELGVPAKRVTIGERFYESEDGEVLLAVDDVRVPGFPTEVVLDGLLVWLADDWERRYEDAPTFEELEIGGREVLAVTFGADDPTEYVLASADTAMRVRGSDSEAAVTMLEALPCRHLDVYPLVTEFLGERMPHRSSGTDE